MEAKIFVNLPIETCFDELAPITIFDASKNTEQ